MSIVLSFFKYVTYKIYHNGCINRFYLSFLTKLNKCAALRWRKVCLNDRLTASFCCRDFLLYSFWETLSFLGLHIEDLL